MTSGDRHSYNPKSDGFPSTGYHPLGMHLEGVDGMAPLKDLFKKEDDVVASLCVQVLKMNCISSEVWSVLVSDSFKCVWVVAYRNLSLESFVTAKGYKSIKFMLVDVQVVMKTLHTGQRVVALKTIDMANYPFQFRKAFAVAHNGFGFTMGNPMLVVPHSVENYALSRCRFSHTVMAAVRVLDWERVLLGGGTDPAVHVYLVRVSDKQGTMIVMCPAKKWNNFLAEQGLQQGGHVLMTLHRLLRSWKDVGSLVEERIVSKYQGVGGLLRGMLVLSLYLGASHMRAMRRAVWMMLCLGLLCICVGA